MFQVIVTLALSAATVIEGTEGTGVLNKGRMPKSLGRLVQWKSMQTTIAEKEKSFLIIPSLFFPIIPFRAFL